MLIIKKVLKHCKKNEELANSYVLHYEEYDDMYQFVDDLGPKLTHSPYKYYYWDDYTQDWELVAKYGMEV